MNKKNETNKDIKSSSNKKRMNTDQLWLFEDYKPSTTDEKKTFSTTERPTTTSTNKDSMVMDEDDICTALSISKATLKNWIRLKKITPDIDGKHFSKTYISLIADDIKNGKIDKLKSRRNKNSISGKLLYKDYISTSQNISTVEEMLSYENLDIEALPIILANFAIQLYYQVNNMEIKQNNLLNHFLKTSKDQEFITLIKDLIGESNYSETRNDDVNKALNLFLKYTYNEDSLGFVYISLRDLGQRKATGAYYTPIHIVSELIENTPVTKKETPTEFLDPCCGTGNFMIGLRNKYKDSASLHGMDCDPISVYISRINIFLITPNSTAADLKDRIIICDTLLNSNTDKFDIVIGNPPWGSNFSDDQITAYRTMYSTACRKGVEAYDLFIEFALSKLNDSGILSFVLPEAILTVSAHTGIREKIISNCCFKYVSYIGNVFTGVQCPAILLCLGLENPGMITGCKVSTKNNDFIITKHRKLNADLLSFNISDQDAECMAHIENPVDKTYLKNNAKFALGIVTGNNKEYLSPTPKDGYEYILKGNDIKKYSIRTGENYIKFTPEHFQQVAPTDTYRAPEKLLYRFICEVPVFTYDNNQLLSLNSCNIVIPKIEGLSIKYILAILNSSIVAYWISKKFNSVKLLRSHIEQVPIPFTSKEKQDEIEKIINEILSSEQDITNLYWKLDEMIADIYQLSSTDRKTINDFISTKNLFL